MGAWWHHNRPLLVSSLVYHVATSIGRTLRFRFVGLERIDSELAAIHLMWHGRTFILGQYFRGSGMRVIISHSRDGEMQNRIFTRLGYTVIRGSTGRGGERALIESIRALRAGHGMAITPDGPRGPAGVVGPGVMVMARKSGAPLLPIGVAARGIANCFAHGIGGTWSRGHLQRASPWPASTCTYRRTQTRKPSKPFGCRCRRPKMHRVQKPKPISYQVIRPNRMEQ